MVKPDGHAGARGENGDCPRKPCGPSLGTAAVCRGARYLSQRPHGFIVLLPATGGAFVTFMCAKISFAQSSGGADGSAIHGRTSPGAVTSSCAQEER